MTYAFHAREVRFERDAGDGFERIFPETFSFHASRHDPAELYLQLDDLARKPRLLSPRANRRDAQTLCSRLLLAAPRYLDRLLGRLEREEELPAGVLTRVYEDVALVAQILQRFLGDRGEESRGLRLASFHLRKLLLRCLRALLERRVDPEVVAGYVAGTLDPVDPADDLSEAGFFHALEGGEPSAVSRCLFRLTERAFYLWLEDVCLDESNRAFEEENSPFESREVEVLRAIAARGGPVRRGRDLVGFLRRPGHRDCRRVLGKLEGWFLRQYDVGHAAAMIHHAAHLERGEPDADRVLSRHGARNYVLAIGALAAPFAAAAAGYRQAPLLFDGLCSGELILVYAAVLWFLLYRFCWRRDLTFFHAAVPRIGAGIIVGYLPIFFIDEVWYLARQSWVTIGTVALLLGFTTFLYLYVEVRGRLASPSEAFARARQIFLLGVLQALGLGLLVTGLMGGVMAERNWLPEAGTAPAAALRDSLPVFAGQLPPVLGVAPFLVFPAAVLLMTFLSFFIGTFLQLMWEDIPITEPL
jgi:hypothetical protein